MATMRAAVPSRRQATRAGACRQELEGLICLKYPNATFEWGVSPEGDAWVLGAHVPVDDDLELAARLASREVDFLEQHGISILTVLVPG